MTITAHILVGGAVAASIPNPYIALPVCIVSHHILDIIPHWDEGWGWRKKKRSRFIAESLFDMIFGFVLGYLLFVKYPVLGLRADFFYFFLCSIFSFVADLLEAPYLFLGWKFPPFSTVYQIQHQLQGRIKLPWGILTQVVTVGVVVLILKLF